MIQAHRRGLLNPSQPFGLRSRLREDVLLETLETELQAEAAIRRAMLLGIFTATMPIKGVNRQKAFKDLAADLQTADLLRLADFDGVAQERFENSSLATERVYDILSQAGWVTGAGEEAQKTQENG